MLPEDYYKQDPCNFNTTEMFVSKVGNPCPTLGQLLASRILYALLVGEKQYEIARARFCTQSCSKVGQLLVNSLPIPHPMGSCRGLPCSSPLATPEYRHQFQRISQLHVQETKRSEEYHLGCIAGNFLQLRVGEVHQIRDGACSLINPRREV